MEMKEAKEKFINAWGTLGNSWGINRAMARIHALLLISPEPMTTDEIMQELQISRGNANMNIRALIDWGIVSKEYKAGERKEYFKADKDVWDLARQVTRERRKREIEPMLKVLAEVSKMPKTKTEEEKELKKVSKSMYDFSTKVDNALARFEKADEGWFSRIILKILQ